MASGPGTARRTDNHLDLVDAAGRGLRIVLYLGHCRIVIAHRPGHPGAGPEEGVMNTVCAANLDAGCVRVTVRRLARSAVVVVGPIRRTSLTE